MKIKKRVIVLKVGQLSRGFDKVAVFVSLFICATGTRVFQTQCSPFISA